MKTLLKIILTPIVLVTIYVLGIFPIYMLGWITRPIDYFFGFMAGLLIQMPILAFGYLSYLIVNKIIK